MNNLQKQFEKTGLKAVIKCKDSLTERAMLALDNYLNAGSKEERAKASEGAKSLYKEYYGVDYVNRNERYL